MAGSSGGSPLRTTFKLSPHINHYADYYAWPAHGNLAHSQAEAIAFSSGQLNVAFPPAYYGDPQGDIDEVFRDLQPDLTALSVPNFFIELKDIRRLFVLWKRKLGLAKNVAGAHLNYSFGWKPLLSDIKEMVGVLQHTMDKLRAFEEAMNKISKSHHTFPSETTTKSGTFTYSTNHKCSWSGTGHLGDTVLLCRQLCRL
jgi:hypothetical protein